MKHTPYLIQRLKRPYKVENEMSALGNAFAFGGGYKNGGLSDDAMKLLKDIWRYDYMGSAEFEYGALPKSLHYIGANRPKYTIGQFEVTARKETHSGGILDYIGTSSNKAIVYYVCEKEHEEEVRKWIEKFADDLKHNYQTKESVNLAGNMLGEEYQKDNVGWHDIDNHYLFFTDKEMFDKFTALLGLSKDIIESDKK